MIKAALHVHLSEPLFIHLESGTTQLWGCCENETSLCYAGGERCVRCAPFRPQGRFLRKDSSAHQAPPPACRLWWWPSAWLTHLSRWTLSLHVLQILLHHFHRGHMRCMRSFPCTSS